MENHSTAAASVKIKGEIWIWENAENGVSS